MTIWGNHSATQYPDLFHAEVAGKNAAETVGDQDWLENTFIPTVAKRGAAIIEARGSSSAASAASATVDAARDWLFGSADDDWVSMAVVSDGSYGVPEGLDLVVPRHHQGRRLGDRPGPGDRRLLARAHRRLDRRARRRAQRGHRARPADLTLGPGPWSGAPLPGCQGRDRGPRQSRHPPRSLVGRSRARPLERSADDPVHRGDRASVARSRLVGDRPGEPPQQPGDRRPASARRSSRWRTASIPASRCGRTSRTAPARPGRAASTRTPTRQSPPTMMPSAVTAATRITR